MSDPHIKRLAVVLALLVLAILAGSLYLYAKPHPLPVPLAPISPTAAVAANPAMVTWTPSSTEVIVSPGETQSVSVSFVSSKNIRRASIIVSPELAPFVRTDPVSFERIRKGEQKTLSLIITPSATSTLGTITGSIQLQRGTVQDGDPEADEQDLRDQGKLLPQALEVAVDVWQGYSNAPVGIRFLIPPGMAAQADSDGQGPVIYVGDAAEEFANGITIRRHTRDLTTVLSEITATLRVASQHQQVINGQTWTIYDFVDPSGGPEFLDAFTTANGALYQVGGKALSLGDVFSKFLTTISFE